MDENLKKRFLDQKIDDLLNDNIKLFPTFICETERPSILEAIRKCVLFADTMKPYTKKCIKPPIKERLEKKKIKNCGELYFLVNLN
jgi:hypothetical protein